ncbi:hypothetical protein GGC65_001524 [Sphingopyxis sp. OAS728]|uniref:hypothetical protein n=1 Tax=Sphingopyxis sp. OAS728 TaxID=2663823 RepID=UPI00178B73B8|nr:hypothetical protein [Sphingopyxis sp. OAS728]MBE1527068.1 hypothetical protein [Sphingopyxis sp. OAS728]
MRLATPLLFLAFPVVLAGCAPAAERSAKDDDVAKYDKAFDSGNDLLVFSIEDGEDHSGGPIKGGKESSDPVLSTGSADLLVTLLAGCGEAKFLIDQGWTHVQYVSVPLKKNNPFRDQTDLELVECVRKNSLFSFGAGIGRAPSLDSSSFKSLYAQKN